MKVKDKKEIFTKTINELKGVLKDKRNELFNLKIELSQRKLKNMKEVFFKRKEIALILTAIREKELLEKTEKVKEEVK